MVRTQLYLDDDVHRRLKTVAAQQGRTVSDLVREALMLAYGAPEVHERVATLDAMAGLWHDRTDLGAPGVYVRRLRRDTRRQRRPG